MLSLSHLFLSVPHSRTCKDKTWKLDKRQTCYPCPFHKWESGDSSASPITDISLVDNSLASIKMTEKQKNEVQGKEPLL